MGAGDLGHVEEGRGGFDHSDQAGRSRRHAALGLDLFDNLGDHAHMLGAVGLGQRERQDARLNHGFDIPHALPPRPVDADHDIGATA